MLDSYLKKEIERNDAASVLFKSKFKQTHHSYCIVGMVGLLECTFEKARGGVVSFNTCISQDYVSD